MRAGRTRGARRGISSLEKVFLGTMALVTSVVLVMFSLYFDVVDMFRSAWDQSSGITIGMRERIDEEARRGRRRREILPAAFMYDRFHGVPSSRDDFLRGAYTPVIPARDKARIIAWARKEAKKRGAKSAELVDLLARGAYRFEIDKLLYRVEVAMIREDHVQAVRLLQDFLTKLDKGDLLHRAELLERLVDLYFVHIKDYPMGRSAALRLERVRREIERIRALG